MSRTFSSGLRQSEHVRAQVVGVGLVARDAVRVGAVVDAALEHRAAPHFRQTVFAGVAVLTRLARSTPLEHPPSILCDDVSLFRSKRRKFTNFL